MEEFIYRAIERVGFPVAVSIVSFWAVYKLFLMRENERNQADSKVAIALGMNTTATKELTDTLKKKLGTDDGKVCQYNEMRAAQAELGLILKAEEEALILRRRAEIAEAKLVEREKIAEEKIAAAAVVADAKK